MDRRGFFKQLLGKGLDQGARRVDAVILPFERAAEAAKAAMPAEEAIEQALAPVDDALAPLEDAIATGGAVSAGRVAVPADPVLDPCAIEDVMRMAADAGLVRHVEAVCALARQSVRLVPADDDPDSVAAPAVRSRFGGAPDLPADVAWPRWRDAPLTFLAQLDLAEVAAAGLTADAGLPDGGLLLLFSAADVAPSGLRPDHFGSTRALLVDAAKAAAAGANALSAPAGPSLPAAPARLALSVEWTVPSTRTEQVKALGLDAAEQAAWERLRAALSERQGVELEDAGDELLALHRLLGAPDDPRGRMPLACELTARGIDADDPTARADQALAAECAASAARWRLLAQLTADERLGWNWGAGRERLHLWVDERDLAAGVLAGVRAIAR